MSDEKTPLQQLNDQMNAASKRPARKLPPEIQKQDEVILVLYEMHKSEADRLWEKHQELWRKHAR